MDIIAKPITHVLHAPSHLPLPHPSFPFIAPGFYSIDFSLHDVTLRHSLYIPSSRGQVYHVSSTEKIIARSLIPSTMYKDFPPPANHRAFVRAYSGVSYPQQALGTFLRVVVHLGTLH